MTTLLRNRCIPNFLAYKNGKGELIKLMLEYELFEEKIFWSSDSDFFQSYLEFLYLNGGKNDENDSGNKHSN